MAFVAVTSKGQTTIPKNVREAANLKPGDRIHFTALEDGTIIVRVKSRRINYFVQACGRQARVDRADESMAASRCSPTTLSYDSSSRTTRSIRVGRASLLSKRSAARTGAGIAAVPKLTFAQCRLKPF